MHAERALPSCGVGACRTRGAASRRMRAALDCMPPSCLPPLALCSTRGADLHGYIYGTRATADVRGGDGTRDAVGETTMSAADSQHDPAVLQSTGRGS